MNPARFPALAHLMGALIRLAREAVSGANLDMDEAAIVFDHVADISERWSRALSQGAPSKDATPLSIVRERLALPQRAIDALLMSLSLEVDPGFGAVWKPFLGQARAPDLREAIDLLEADPIARLRARRLLDPGEALDRWALIEGRVRPMAASRLVPFLMGDVHPDPTLAPCLTPLNTEDAPRSLGLPRVDTEIQQLIPRLMDAGSLGLLVLRGPDSATRLEAASILARGLNCPTLLIDLVLNPTPEAGLIKRWLREAALLGACLVIDGAVIEDKADDVALVIGQLLEGAPGAVILLNQHHREANIARHRQYLWRLQVPRPSLKAQEALWDSQLQVVAPVDPTIMGEALAARFDMTAPQITTAARLARTRADERGAGEAIDLKDLERGSVEVFTHRLKGLAWRVPEPRLAWDDLVVDFKVRRQLGMMMTYLKHRRGVYEGWGVERLLSGGKGVKALFYGPPGTGKTLAASILGRELGLDVYQVDLSQIVSKWVGETEKNLDRVLSAAEDSQVILLFDEADALFGERGEVKSATDRYANMEVNYLLQRFDHYDGSVILTSNLQDSVDKAFSRRLHFIVEFPAPDEHQRLELWRRMLADPLPVDPDVPLEDLARRFELAGGNIRNAVVTAAFLAAEAGTAVSHLHLLQALAWEMQKEGMLPSRQAFGALWGELE